jgi:hypothetical protein
MALNALQRKYNSTLETIYSVDQKRKIDSAMSSKQFINPDHK